MIRQQFAAQEAQDITGNLGTNCAPFPQGVSGALQSLWQGRILAVRNEHRKQIHSQCAAGALDKKLILNWLHIPRQLNLTCPVCATNERPPFVVPNVWIHTQPSGISELGLHIFNVTEEGLHQIQRVDTEVAKRIAALPILWRQRASKVRRIIRTAEIING